MYGSDAVDGSPQRHRNVPKRNRDSLITGAILAFAERLLLAINGHWRAYLICPLCPRNRTCNQRCPLNTRFRPLYTR